MTTGALPLIPTTVCGSHGLPAWLHLVREAAAAGRLGPVDLQECYDDAVRIAMRDQVESGVDVISDGAEGAVKDARELMANLNELLQPDNRKRIATTLA